MLEVFAMTSLVDEAVTWSPVGLASSEEFARARTEALNVAQWLVRIANSYVDHTSGLERILLSYRPADQAFVTRPFFDNLAVEMRLPSLKLQFLEGDKPTPHVFDPHERSPAEVEAWILVELLHRGLDRTRFSKALPYSIAGLMTGDADDYAPATCQLGLEELARWFNNATAVMRFLVTKVGDGMIACWPETMELKFVGYDEHPIEIIFSPGQGETRGPSFSMGRADGPKTELTASELARVENPVATTLAFMNAAAR